MEKNHTGTVLEVIIDGVATGVAAVGKQNPVPEDGVVVIVVVADKDRFHVAATLHRGKHPGIVVRAAADLTARAD